MMDDPFETFGGGVLYMLGLMLAPLAVLLVVLVVPIMFLLCRKETD